MVKSLALSSKSHVWTISVFLFTDAGQKQRKCTMIRKNNKVFQRKNKHQPV